MYEDMTFENLMDRCLKRVAPSIDKREGSVVYDAIAPAVAELAIMYQRTSNKNESPLHVLPLFANEVGWAIPEEYSDLFADLVIIGAVLLVSCKYIKEAFTKFTAILNAGPVDIVNNTAEPEETQAATPVIGFTAGKDVTENE